MYNQLHRLRNCRIALSLCIGFGSVRSLVASTPAVALPELAVYSTAVANQTPVGTFAMPVSALRFEPRIDLQARNLAEGQSDLTVRGGIFENTGLKLGAVSLPDPQTGHYTAEVPVAPAMLSAPQIRTGPDLALGSANASVGAIEYSWREIRPSGAAAFGWGDFRMRRAELYQGYATAPTKSGAVRYGADFAVAHSEANGSVPWGEHEFDRLNLRLQRKSATAQTDFVGGYQSKRFGWPNLYTPFNSNETENLQTTLFALNHRVTTSGGNFWEAGAFSRRNKDDYAFNRFAPLASVHPFQHTTWLSGVATRGRQNLGVVDLNFQGELLHDKLQSSSLIFGRFNSRTLSKMTLLPEKSWVDGSGDRLRLSAGLVREDSNRDSGRVSPVIVVARELSGGSWRGGQISYAESSQVASYTALNSSATAGLFRGNSTLGRSVSRNLELGSRLAAAGWDLDGTVFWRRDDALVDWTFRRGVTARTANAVDIDVVGFEAVARRSTARCDWVFGYTTLAKRADYRGAVVDASFYALNYARHRLTAALTLRLGAGFELRLDNVARIQADNLLRVTGGDRAVISSAAVAYRPRAWKGFEFSVQANNLWDEKFQEVPAVPAAGRQVSARVAYAW